MEMEILRVGETYNLCFLQKKMTLCLRQWRTWDGFPAKSAKQQNGNKGCFTQILVIIILKSQTPFC